MARFVLRTPLRARSQRGFAMIMLITMAVLMSSYLLATLLTRTSTEVRLSNDERTRQALMEARAALIAYAASQAWTGSSSTDQPGSLPCPSSDEDGTSASSCDTEATRIGRFPWKTIGAQKPYDGSGNVLWYALASEFRKKAGTTIINSDTTGSLTVTGAAPATSLVAVIIAPGSPVSGQARSTSSSVDTYLESSNANTSDTDTFVSANVSSDSFNDQIMPVTQSDLMAVVEPAVAARIERDIKPSLATYASQWSGAYPFPATFPQGTAVQDSYSGSTSAQYGLLPVTASQTYPWVSGSGTVTITGGTASSTASSVTCVTVGGVTPGWKCTFTINGVDLGSGYASSSVCQNGATPYRYCIINPSFTVTGDVSNAGLGFAYINPTTATDITITNSAGTTARSMSSKSVAASLKASGAGTITFSGTHSYSSYSNTTPRTRVMVVTIPDRVNASSITNTSASNSTGGWFINQQWYRQTYYAVSPDYLPSSSSHPATCTPGTNTCLTVNSLPSSYTTSNDKKAILVLMGRSLNSSSRPSSTLSDYLEGENASPSDHVFVHRSGAASSINDRVVVVAP